MSSAQPTQKQFFALAIPNMLAGLAIPITLLIDIAYLGHLDSVLPLSGVVLATVIFDYIFWCFSFLRIGTTGLTAQAHGRNDRDEQAALFWRPMIIGLAIGIILTILQKPIADLSFLILSGGADVELAGREYFNAHIMGAIPVMLNFAIIGWLLGQGKSGTVWILHTVWQLSNIILNYFFIVKFGWGAWGAGLGTAIAEWSSAIVGIIMVCRYWRCLPVFDKDRILHWLNLKPLLTLNSAIMMRTLLLMTVLASFTNISASFGTVPLAANALMMKLFVSFAIIIDGFAITLETLAGRSLGKESKAELRRSFSLAIRWTVIITALFVMLYASSAQYILLLLTEHQDIIDYAINYIWWLCAVISFGGIAFVYDGFFYGLAKPKQLFSSMILAVLAFAPLAYYAWNEKSTTWLWVAFLTFIITRVVTLFNPARKALRETN